MANDSFKVKKGLNIEPNTSPNLSTDGDIGFNSTDSNLELYTGGSVKKVLTNSQAQVITAKDIDGGTASNTSRITLPKAAKTTLDGLTRKEGTILYASDQQKAYVDNGSSLIAVGSGSGGGGINYFSANSDAEIDTAGWATYADAAGTSPVDGTGGSPNVTFTRTTSSPLRGTASFLFTKDAVNRQGQGASYNFNLDSADGGKMMQITFDYAIASGTYATGDLAVYVIHDPNGTPKIIQPSGYQIENVGVNSTARLTFQTEVSAQLDYTLCFHVVSTSASAYTVKLDNVQLGPQVVPLGAPVTDWVSYTPSVSAISGTLTNFTAQGYWRRKGDSADYKIRLVFTGAPGTWSNPLFSLPSGQVIDDAKIPGGAISGYSDENWGTAIDTGTQSYKSAARPYTTTTLIMQQLFISGSAVTLNSYSQASPFTWASTDEMEFTIKNVPIVGWSSSTVVSSSAATNVNTASMLRGTNQTGVNPNNSTVKINFDGIAEGLNSLGAVNTASSRIDIKVPGSYRVDASLFVNSTNVLASGYGMRLFKNGVEQLSLDYRVAVATTDFVLKGSNTANYVAGDYIEIYLFGAGNNSASTLTVANSSLTRFTVTQIQGPSQIAASEVIAFRASNTAGTSFTGGAGFVDVPFVTEAFDTHGAFATPTFTAPAPGLYELSFNLFTNGATLTTSQSAQAQLVVTGASAANYSGFLDTGNGASKNLVLNGSIILQMNAGDTAKLQFASDVTAVLNSSTGRNYFQAQRLGGVM